MTGGVRRRVLRAPAAGVGGLHGLVARRSTAQHARALSARLRRLGPDAVASSSSRSRCSGGRCGIRAPSRAAAATSRSGCSRRAAERDALVGTLFFNVVHYALRPWPWIIVALASMLVFPTLADIRARFPYVDPALIGHDMAYPAMLTFLPAGFLGLMVAGMLAAYARRSRRTSTGARRISCTTSTAASCGRARAERHYVLRRARGHGAADDRRGARSRSCSTPPRRRST